MTPLYWYNGSSLREVNVSSNLKIASFDRSVLEYKIVTDSALGLAPIVDVTGSSGTLYDISLDLSTGISVATYYLKL